MSKKRGREQHDGDAAHAAAPVKFEEVTRAVLSVVRKWRDTCGSEYHIKVRVETSDDASTIRVGSFDELACERIIAVLDAHLPGDYTITSSHCDLAKKGLVLLVRRTRVRTDGAAPAKEARTDGQAPADTGGGGGVSSEFVRLRVSNLISDKSDAESVVAAMNSVMVHLARGATWTLASGPAVHVVSFKITDAKLDTAAVRAACAASGAGNASAVDFERSVLRVAVPKSHPEIV
jgi:hypothetical protein